MEQPDTELQRELNDIIENRKEKVEIAGTHRLFSRKPRYVRMGYMHYGTMRRLTDISLDRRTGTKNESKVLCREAAVLRLNGYFSIALFYWAVWRWYYYIRQYHIEQLLGIFQTAKKKVPQTGYYLATMLTTNMRDTVMAMTREEVEHTLHAQQSAKQE